MLEQQNNEHNRKYGWIDKCAKMTGERARIDAKVNQTYSIYEKDGKIVKEYADGRILPFVKEGER